MQRLAHTSRDRVDILHHRTVLQTDHIVRDGGVDKSGAEQFGPYFGVLAVLAADGEVTKALQRDLLRMTRTGDDAELVERDAETVVQIVGDDDVLVRDHTLDGRDHHFMRHIATDLIERLLHVGRRNRENQHVGLRYRLIDIRREVNPSDVKTGCAKIRGVLASRDELIDHFLTTDEPVDLTLVLHHDLRQGGCPRTRT